MLQALPYSSSRRAVSDTSVAAVATVVAAVGSRYYAASSGTAQEALLSPLLATLLDAAVGARYALPAFGASVVGTVVAAVGDTVVAVVSATACAASLRRRSRRYCCIEGYVDAACTVGDTVHPAA